MSVCTMFFLSLLASIQREILSVIAAKDWHPFLPDDLYDTYPSHLHIDIMPRGQVRVWAWAWAWHGVFM